MEEHSAGVVVVCNGEFLLLHYDSGHWDLPKGHIEKDETPSQAAIRELEEETGIKSDILPDFSYKINYFFRRDKKLISKDVIFFLAKVDDKKVVLSFEHKDFIWLSFDKAVEKATFKSTKDVLMLAKRFIDKDE